MRTRPEAGQPAGSCYVVPGRMLQGSRAEMLAEIEEAVQALMALRLIVLAEAPPAQSSPPAKR
jgi:hypothetical protein